MASKNNRSNISLEQRLSGKNARSFDFYQAVYLLEKIAAKNNKKIKILPKPGRAFSGTPIDEIIESDDAYVLVANLSGLYSSGSPLPNYYLDELLSQINDNELQTKGFLDIFHQRVYHLLFEAWEQHNLPFQLFLKDNTNIEHMLYGLAGISYGRTSKLLAKIPQLKKYLPHFMAGNRTLMSLQSLLNDFFTTDIEVQSFYQAKVKINRRQQNQLGEKNTKLGSVCYLGDTYTSKCNNIRLTFASMSKSIFDSFLPGGEKHQQLLEILQTFLYTPLNCYLTVSLAAEDIRGLSLGDNAFNRLGNEAWLATHPAMPAHSFTYQLKLNT